MRPGTGYVCDYTVELGDSDQRCTREVGDPETPCIFHKDVEEKDSEETLDQFLQSLVEGPSSRPISDIEDAPSFVGAKFGRVEFRRTEVVSDCPYPLDLRRAEFRRLDLSSSRILLTVQAKHINVEESIVAKGAEFESTVNFSHAEISGNLDLSGAVFDRELQLRDAEIDGDLILRNATLRSGLDCENLDLSGSLYLDEIEIQGRSNFRESTVINDVIASAGTFRGPVDIAVDEWGPISGLDTPIDFSRTNFLGDVDVGGDFDNNLTFEKASFNGRLAYEDAKVNGDLTLTDVSVKNLRFTDGEVRGTMQIASTDVRDFVINDSELGNLEINRSTIDGDCTLSEIHIRNDFSFEKSDAVRQFEVENIEVDRGIRARQSQFGALCSWTDVDCGKSMILDDVQFNANISLQKLYLNDYLNLENSRCNNDVDIAEIFAKGIDLSETVFRNDLNVENIVLERGDLNFTDCNFEFTECLFQGVCRLEDVRAVGDIRADGSRFLDELEIVNSRAYTGFSLRNSVVENEVRLRNVETSRTGVIDVDFASATLESGEIVNKDGPLYDIDFTSATIGNVYFESNDDEIFGHLLFRKTDFTEFDFSQYRTALVDEEWKLHAESVGEGVPSVNKPQSRDSKWDKLLWLLCGPIIPTRKTWRVGREIAKREKTAPDSSTSEEQQSNTENRPGGSIVEENPTVGDEEVNSGPIKRSDVETLETTYLKAKSGADRVGAKNVASEYFLREMHYRQLLHAIDFHSGHWKALGRWLGNTTMRLSSGYGERPHRVVFSAIATMVAFGLFYLYSGSNAVGGPIDAFAISAGSFVTLIFSSTPQFSSNTMQLIAMIEGFLGAIFVALLVFTLTRSIHR